jgi:heme A synthase
MVVNRFAKYAWVVLAFNILVILWGAYVRATGSGAGCGNHWPLCDGQVIPRAPEIKTLIEFSHRVTSGVALLLVLGLLIWAFRAYPRGHLIRRGATASFLLIVVEALLGAGLVLFELVAHNDSLARAISVALHLANTFLLLGALTLTAWWASGHDPIDLRGQAPLTRLLGLGLAGTILIGASGAIVALGDTLFPAQSLAAGLGQDLDSTAHFLIRLRVIHPLIAVGVGLYLIIVAAYFGLPNPSLKRSAQTLIVLVVIQLSAGSLNVLLLAPVWMQIVHLLLADLTWVALVAFSASTLSRHNAPQQAYVHEYAHL